MKSDDGLMSQIQSTPLAQKNRGRFLHTPRSSDGCDSGGPTNGHSAHAVGMRALGCRPAPARWAARRSRQRCAQKRARATAGFPGFREWVNICLSQAQSKHEATRPHVRDSLHPANLASQSHAEARGVRSERVRGAHDAAHEVAVARRAAGGGRRVEQTLEPRSSGHGMRKLGIDYSRHVNDSTCDYATNTRPWSWLLPRPCPPTSALKRLTCD